MFGFHVRDSSACSDVALQQRRPSSSLNFSYSSRGGRVPQSLLIPVDAGEGTVIRNYFIWASKNRKDAHCLYELHSHLKAWGWRDGSEVKSTHCSRRGSGFSPQYPHGDSKLFRNPALKD